MLSHFNQHFNLSRPEIDVFQVNALREMNSLLILKLNQREINILTHLGLKLPSSSLRVKWNEQPAHFEMKLTSLLSSLNMKSRKGKGCNLSEINIFGVAWKR